MIGYTPPAHVPSPDPHWLGDLRNISPTGEGATWLELYFEEGYPWQPVNRWMVGEIFPHDMISPSFHEAMGGPDPRNYTVYDWHRRKVVRRSGANRRAWLFYRDTGCLLVPYWVIQGSRGGHRYDLSTQEKMILEARGLDPEMEIPDPGQLPYAEPDHRTWEHILRYDLINRGIADTKTKLRETHDDPGIEVDQWVYNSHVELTRARDEWLAENIGDAFGQLAFELKKESDSMPTVDRETFMAREAERERDQELLIGV